MKKTVTLERQELDYLHHWHSEQADFCDRHEQTEQAKWHRERLTYLSEQRYSVIRRAGGLDCGVDLRTGKGVCVCGRCSSVLRAGARG